MQQIIQGLKIVFSKKESIFVFFFSLFLMILGFFAIYNFQTAIQIFSFNLPILKKTSLFFGTFFDMTQIYSVQILPLFIFGVAFGALTVSLIFTYVKIRKDLLVKSGMYSGFGLLLAILGLGCAACGTVVLQVVFSFLGFGGLISFLPYKGLEIGYIGLTLLVINSLLLAKRLGKPLVC